MQYSQQGFEIAYTDIYPIYAGFEHCDPNFFNLLCNPDAITIHYVFSGTGKVFSPRGNFRVTAGQAFIILAEESVSYRADGEDPWFYCWLRLGGRLTEKFAALPPVVDCTAETAFRTVAYKAESGVRAAASYMPEIWEIYNSLLTLDLSENDVRKTIRHRIDKTYMDDISVEKLAAEFGFDRRYLSRIFAERYGTGIKEYILRKRIHRAKSLLGSHSVSEAGALVGYPDAVQFSKIFRKKVGISPSEFKKKLPPI